MQLDDEGMCQGSQGRCERRKVYSGSEGRQFGGHDAQVKTFALLLSRSDKQWLEAEGSHEFHAVY
ncbi:hypothetical protein E2C01_013352 [Portunus trituberculatus]|uniref:Uncharacterized protein n=1 Tax=Portunus trituberculatus TaxID=210409 RepID=A0A5B7DGV2_PORTR|nr:hypothetical protein [Portunus trituberculatus]